MSSKQIPHSPAQAVIFDFGGVLLDWDPRYLYTKIFNGDSARMERFLEEIDFHAWNSLQDKGRSFDDGVAALSGRFPEYADLIHAYHARWEESISGPLWSTVEIVRALKDAGYPLYALSNFSIEKYEITRRRYAFFELFDDILLSAEVGLLKPDPRIFRCMLERINYPPEECVFIDDSPANVEAAGRLGFRAIHFRGADRLRADLFKHLNASIRL